MEKAVSFRTIMKDPYRDHPPEDALERFLMNQSDEDELEIVETHFLACEICVSRLEIIELNLAATRMALQNQRAEQAAKLVESASKTRKWFSLFTLPRLSFAAASLACAFSILFLNAPREVNLVADRGNETTAVAEWVPLQFHLLARELSAGSVTVEMVNGEGKRIWQQAASVKNDQIDVTAPRLTESGNYLIRVYSPSASDPAGDLVKEYSIRAGTGL